MAPYFAEIDLLPGVISTVISVSSPSDSEAINFLTSLSLRSEKF